MAPDAQRRPSVLIVDPDAAIRGMLEMVLKRAGFRAVSAGDIETETDVLETSHFSVILRDVSSAPPESRNAWQRLAASSPEVLRRTIVMTTAPARAQSAMAAGSVFAIVSKPFDINELVNAVSACARNASAEPSTSAGDASPRLESLHRFVSTVPSLQQMLSVPVTSHREAALRAEMRRTLGALAATLTQAADGEASRTRAAAFRAASNAAARLATRSTRRRDH